MIFANMEKKTEIYSNLYTTCKDIPMDIFIEVYCGKPEALIITGNMPKRSVLQSIADNIVMEYCSIINNNMFEITIHDKILNNCIRLQVLESAKMLFANYRFAEAVQVLSTIKMRFDAPKSIKEANDIIKKIDSNIALYKKQLESDKRHFERKEAKTDRAYFMQEAALLSSHNKFYINIKEITAEAYAYMVKQMNEDLKHLKKWQTKQK